jgi:hypothetical protein
MLLVNNCKIIIKNISTLGAVKQKPKSDPLEIEKKEIQVCASKKSPILNNICKLKIEKEKISARKAMKRQEIRARNHLFSETQTTHIIKGKKES